MMTSGTIVAVMLTACIALILSHPATLAQATDRHAVRRFANVVDLTHTLDEYLPYIPVPGITFPFRKTPIATVARNGVAANRWEIHEHLGTQIDAPIHFFFFEGALSLDQLPVASLVVPLAVIDISARAASHPDTSDSGLVNRSRLIL